MAERQSHGFAFQRAIIAKYGLTPDVGYTAQWDAHRGSVPVSIKSAKAGCEVELGDLFRNASIDYDFYMIVGFWSGLSKEIIDERCLLIDGDDWAGLFTHESDQIIKDFLHEITNARNDDAAWRVFVDDMKHRWAVATRNLVRPRFKRDHKIQKRMQCAISWDDFYGYFVPRYECRMDAAQPAGGGAW